MLQSAADKTGRLSLPASSASSWGRWQELSVVLKQTAPLFNSGPLFLFFYYKLKKCWVAAVKSLWLLIFFVCLNIWAAANSRASCAFSEQVTSKHLGLQCICNELWPFKIHLERTLRTRANCVVLSHLSDDASYILHVAHLNWHIRSHCCIAHCIIITHDVTYPAPCVCVFFSVLAPLHRYGIIIMCTECW